MTGETARLFVALELPEAPLRALQSWADDRLGAVTGLRRVDRAALHVTLCFLGSQPVGEIEAIGGACRVVAGRGPVQLRLGAPVWLPRRRPRVLAVGIEAPSEALAGGREVLADGYDALADGSDALAGLQAVLAAELESGGWYEREARPFLPHVTLGRFGRSGGRAVELDPPPAVHFEGVSVVLLRSWPEPGGSRYEPLASVGLGSGV